LASEKLKRLTPVAQSQTQDLQVRIFSFSFHHDPPKDESGNGGDLFSMPAACRTLAGRALQAVDGERCAVIDYLNQQEGVHQFLANAVALVEASVASYQQRGFRNLIGVVRCTGGQHRSVFLAEHLAKRLRGQPGVEVAIKHLKLEKMGR